MTPVHGGAPLPPTNPLPPRPGLPAAPAPYPRTLPRALTALDTLAGYTATTTRCPSCGQQLSVVGVAARTPQHAPWLCTEERLMFWNVELHPEARKCYRAAQRDWGSSSKWLRLAVAVERERRI